MIWLKVYQTMAVLGLSLVISYGLAGIMTINKSFNNRMMELLPVVVVAGLGPLFVGAVVAILMMVWK